MAAPLKRRLTLGIFTHSYRQLFPSSEGKTSVQLSKSQTLRYFAENQRSPLHYKPRIGYKTWVGGSVVVGAALYLGGQVVRRREAWKVFAETQLDRPQFKPSRQVKVDTDSSGLKLTLYQFQTCPFCCKVRAVLDYHGFSYDVIEVNSVTKKQIKWSEYPKVPILVVKTDATQQEVVIKDSSVIISVLESYLHDRTTNLAKYVSYYPCLTEDVGRKKKFDFANKYFIMFQETTNLSTTPEYRKEERKWRKWADDHLVHMLSPNAYRTVKEALQAFHYFSAVGQWEQNFSFLERQVIIYVGAAVMYVMGMILKSKYNLKDDVRQSLYDACNEWLTAVGKDRPFMGGNQPNLADLAVYGVLNSIEGCYAFQDALTHTQIGQWYNRTKTAVQNHHGAHPHNVKGLPSDIPKLKDKH
ncbi:hypothetical protein BsWGS_23775 [Bradybaena similaris]